MHWFDVDALEPREFGGPKWIQSSHSWNHLAQVTAGDLVFCYQSDKMAFLGMTVAATPSYEKSEIQLGPQKVAFSRPLRFNEIRDMKMGAFVQGKRSGTFHPVEERFIVPLIEMILKQNPESRESITGITRLEGLGLGQGIHDYELVDIILDPIRREIVHEVLVRNAKWVLEAKERYGYACMIPGCDFELIKEDGEQYIEVHHIVPMFDGGKDELMNLSVLCPNHHREIHYATVERRKELTARVRREQTRRLMAADD